MKRLLTIILGAIASVCSAQQRFVGGDVSVLQKYEDYNVAYYDQDGKKIDNVLKYMKSETVGWNAQRVRLFVDPSGNKDPQVCQDLDYVTRLANRIKTEGFALMIDFHYSDTWADPAQQTKPKAWSSLTTAQLTDKVYEYTKNCLEHLKANGAQPDFIQVGNEITCGMLWPDGRVNSTGYSNWDAFAAFLKAGIKACREVCPGAKTIIHLEHLQDAAYTVSNYKKLQDLGVDFDVMGLSYYPFWHKDLTTLSTTLRQLAANFPNKKVQIVETAYYYQWQPNVGNGIYYDYKNIWPISPAGQASYAKALVTELKKHDNVNALYWWFPEENGNGPNSAVLKDWVNRGLWDDNTHRALPALYELKAFADDPAGIGNVIQTDSNQYWYNLQGMRLNGYPQNGGLYITEGKKVIIH